MVRIVPLAWRFVIHDRVRFAITTSGIACAVALMLFLFATVEGVKVEANGYVAQRPVSVWLGQKSASNLIRSTSFMHASLEDAVRAVPGVGEVTPLLRVIASMRLAADDATLFVFGFDPSSALSAPTVVRGSASPQRGEIILDRAFAAKHRIALGETVDVQDRAFRVVGLSRGSNALIIQFAFVPIDDAHELMDLNRELVSFFLVRGQAGTDADRLAAALSNAFPRLGAITQEAFADNNLEEMRTGVLPVLASVAFAGGTLALAVLTLMLYANVVDAREHYALLKAIGAEQVLLIRLVVRQALLTATCGCVAGLLLYWAGAPVVLFLVPELTQALVPTVVGNVFVAVLTLAFLSAWLPAVRLGSVYPAEVFRA